MFQHESVEIQQHSHSEQFELTMSHYLDVKISLNHSGKKIPFRNYYSQQKLLIKSNFNPFIHKIIMNRLKSDVIQCEIPIVILLVS